MAIKKKQLRKDDYTVGWICALPDPEWKASRLLFDEEHDVPALGPRINYQYAFGSMNGHNVVMGCSTQMGKGAAAAVAAEMNSTFTLRFGLLVGVAGGVPSDNHDVRLGDVVVGQPDLNARTGGVVGYDFGKAMDDGQFMHTGMWNQPPEICLSALGKIKSAPLTESRFNEYLASFKQHVSTPQFAKKPSIDRLFKSAYSHVKGEETCSNCHPEHEIQREPRETGQVGFHYGTLASGDEVMKDAHTRDRISKELGNVICFEMEAAGLMNHFPCLVIRGICDYCDSHKNKDWQPFAAATAASWAKELLRNISKPDIKEPEPQQKTVHAKEGSTRSRFIRKRPTQKSKPDDNTLKLTADVKNYRDSLFTANPTDDREGRDLLVSDTCEWIDENSTYKSWLNGESRFLWISGRPGKGKTMLSIFLTQQLERTLPEHCPVLYYFCDGNDTERNNEVSILRTLLWQLADHAYESDDVEFKKCIRRIFMSQEKSADHFTQKESLWRTFAAAVKDSAIGTVYAVIDGLDECDFDTKEWLVKKFESLFLKENQTTDKTRLNLLIVSRDMKALARLSADEVCTCLKLEDGEIDVRIREDIERVVSSKLGRFSHLPDFDDEVKEHLQQELIRLADGSFVYVSCAIKDLENENTCTGLKQRLGKLPKGLIPFFRSIIDQTKGPGENDTTPWILQWAAVVLRPLSVSELRDVMQMRSRGSNSPNAGRDEKTAAENDQIVKDEVNKCSPLLEIRKDTVSLFHESARDFLLGHGTNGAEVSYVDEPEAHLEIAQVLLECIRQSRLKQEVLHANDESTWNAFPLLRYAVTCWPIHARLAGVRSTELLDSANFISQAKSSIRTNWWRTYVNLQKEDNDNDRDITLHDDEEKINRPRSWQELNIQREMDQEIPSPLHMACRFGLAEWVRVWINGFKRQKDLARALMLQDAYGVDALSWAAMEGHDQVVRILLENKANPDAMSALQRQTAFSTLSPARRAHSYIREMTDGDALWTGKHTALYRALFRGHTEVAKLLLDYRADPTIKAWADFTALHGAALNGNEDMMRALFDQSGSERIDLNAQLKLTLITPLHYLVEGDHYGSTKILLNQGAKVDLTQRHTWCSALHCAIQANASTRLIELLIDSKADIHTRVIWGEAAIHMAARYASAATTQLLLDRGVGIDSRTYFEEETALHLAARSSRDSTLQVLLKGKANVNARNTGGRTALHIAAAEGTHDTTIEQLLDAGADINAKDNEGETPLHLAAKRSTGDDTKAFDIAQILLDRTAKVNAVNVKQRTPLDKAAGHQLTKVIELIRSRGGVLHRPDKTVRLNYPELYDPLPNDPARTDSSTLSLVETLDSVSLRNGSGSSDRDASKSTGGGNPQFDSEEMLPDGVSLSELKKFEEPESMLDDGDGVALDSVESTPRIDVVEGSPLTESTQSSPRFESVQSSPRTESVRSSPRPDSGPVDPSRTEQSWRTGFSNLSRIISRH